MHVNQLPVDAENVGVALRHEVDELGDRLNTTDDVPSRHETVAHLVNDAHQWSESSNLIHTCEFITNIHIHTKNISECGNVHIDVNVQNGKKQTRLQHQRGNSPGHGTHSVGVAGSGIGPLRS